MEKTFYEQEAEEDGAQLKADFRHSAVRLNQANLTSLVGPMTGL